MTQNDLNDTVSVDTKKTSPIEGFKMGRVGVSEVLKKELGAGPADVSYVKETYAEMVSLKLARGKKDPERSGTIGYLVHPDGVLEELDDKTKLVDLAWGSLTESALVIAYLSLQRVSYRVYGGQKLADLFGVSEDDSL